jgi:hypothetical protein
MNKSWSVTGMVILYAAGLGLLLLAFTMIQDFFRYLFSLLAFLLALRFFSTYETWGPRIAFIIVSFLFYIIDIIIYTMIAYVNGWPIPGMEASLV